MELNLSDFSFLRPLWLLGLLLLPLVWWLWRHRRTQRGAWAAAVDAHLLPHLLQQLEVRGAHRSSLLWLLTGALAIVALAGPSWRQQAAPLWQKEAPLVIALDMSAAMRAADLPPSRLVQVRAKLGRLLQQRRNGQVGLLAYAGDAFTVAPITRDARTVSALLDSLDPDVMPVEGQRSDRAIRLALKLLADSNAGSGEILLVTDQVDTAGNFAAVQARTAGITVSVLGVGTLTGAPLTGKNGFITGADGQPRLARLDPVSLSALAVAGGGRYAALSSDDSDLQALAVLDPVGRAASAVSESGGTRDDVGVTRSDDGYWLLLALLPLMLLGFRRGWLAALPLILGLSLVMPGEQAMALEPATDVAPPAQQAPDSAPPESGFSWDALWQRADQRAHAALAAGDTERARQLAPNPALKGAASFRGDDYPAAAEAWAQDDAADAHYNRGNALAKSGKLEEALRAYDDALARQPDMDDALANRKAVEDFLKQQQQQQQQSKDGQQGEQNKDQQQGEQQQGEQQQGEQQQGEQQQASSSKASSSRASSSKASSSRASSSSRRAAAERRTGRNRTATRTRTKPPSRPKPPRRPSRRSNVRPRKRPVSRCNKRWMRRPSRSRAKLSNGAR